MRAGSVWFFGVEIEHPDRNLGCGVTYIPKAHFPPMQCQRVAYLFRGIEEHYSRRTEKPENLIEKKNEIQFLGRFDTLAQKCAQSSSVRSPGLMGPSERKELMSCDKELMDPVGVTRKRTTGRSAEPCDFLLDEQNTSNFDLATVKSEENVSVELSRSSVSGGNVAS